jgi:hypothetical protein
MGFHALFSNGVVVPALPTRPLALLLSTEHYVQISPENASIFFTAMLTPRRLTRSFGWKEGQPTRALELTQPDLSHLERAWSRFRRTIAAIISMHTPMHLARMATQSNFRTVCLPRW